jgi:uncharacterized membrane protein YozB (DUF420 family)
MTEHLLLTVIFVVLMVLWLVTGWAPAPAPYSRAASFIPWACVAILGWLVFHG